MESKFITLHRAENPREYEEVIVFVNPAVNYPSKPVLVKTFQYCGEWAALTHDEHRDVAGWATIEEIKRLIES